MSLRYNQATHTESALTHQKLRSYAQANQIRLLLLLHLFISTRP